VNHFFAISLVGIVTGCIFAVAASGLVVTYTTSGIFNFAHGAMGMFLAFTYWELRVHQHWPAPIALFVTLLVIAPLMGAAIERVLIRNLHGKETRVALVVTFGLLVVLLGLAQVIWTPTKSRSLPFFFNGHHIRLFGVAVQFHDLIVLAVAVLTAIGLRLLLFRTRLGVTMRAVVDDPELGSLNGAHPERVSQFAWALGAMLAGVGGVLIAPEVQLSHSFLTLLVVYAYAAAILGKLRSLPLTFLGGLVIGLLDAYAIGYGGSGVLKIFGEVKAILPTIFLFAILVFLPQVRLRAGRAVGVSTPRVPGFRQSLAGAGVVLAFAIFASQNLSEFWLATVSESFVFAIVMLSLVLLSGYAGQVSLMQIVFVGAGCLAMGRVGGGGLIGLLAAAAFAAVFGVLVAIPALRLQDLYLALTTLAFAIFAEWAFNQRWLLDLGGALKVPRLHVAGVAFHSEAAQLILIATIFALVAVGVLALRRGPYGRLLTAMRDSPTACTTLGVNLVFSKTTVFALSAAIAGVAGALYGGLHTTVSAGDFLYIKSLIIFLIASFGGLTTITGALFGGFFFVLIPELQKHIPIDNIQFVGIGLGAIALADNPNGFGGNVAQLGELVRARFGRGDDNDEAAEPATRADINGSEATVVDVPEPAVIS
jgi:branched-chain amino acid transport system permease protein